VTNLMKQTLVYYLSYGMRLLSLISRAFKERQYRRAYLKQMHESLKDRSERTLAVRVYHTPVTVQPRKNQE